MVVDKNLFISTFIECWSCSGFQQIIRGLIDYGRVANHTGFIEFERWDNFFELCAGKEFHILFSTSNSGEVLNALQIVMEKERSEKNGKEDELRRLFNEFSNLVAGTDDCGCYCGTDMPDMCKLIAEIADAWPNGCFDSTVRKLIVKEPEWSRPSVLSDAPDIEINLNEDGVVMLCFTAQNQSSFYSLQESIPIFQKMLELDKARRPDLSFELERCFDELIAKMDVWEKLAQKKAQKDNLDYFLSTWYRDKFDDLINDLLKKSSHNDGTNQILLLFDECGQCTKVEFSGPNPDKPAYYLFASCKPNEFIAFLQRMAEEKVSKNRMSIDQADMLLAQFISFIQNGKTIAT